jgi:catechol 2,3-dioxygenase-like lactoylglutathione lyase family enzyme
MPVLKSAAPILFVRDVPASAAFFRDKLGFDIDFLHGTPPFYGAVSRGGACLHLRFVREPVFSKAAARGVDFAQEIVEQPWGGTDFHVRDPDGNAVAFVSFA